MKNRKKAYVGILVLLVSMLLLIVPAQPAKAQFVIAWDYDSESGYFDYDDYGQGFYLYHLMTNYTYPDWNLHPNHTTNYYFNESSYVHEWDVGYAIGIRFLVWMNSTLTGASDLADGLTFMRLNATITALGVDLDTQDDLDAFYQTTYFDAEMWLYGFNAYFDVIAEEGVTYTATLTYEVYW